MNKNKIFVISILIVTILIIFISIFLISNYKNEKNGNNIINKSEEDIVGYILNMQSYEAKMDVTVETNRNTNKYVITQKKSNNISEQEVIEPNNIAGVITQYDGTNLKIKNTKLDLETIYENYSYIVENQLWLDSFIKEFNESNKSEINVENNEIVLEIKNERISKYQVHKKLYIDKKTGKPTKMIIEDINQNKLVYILYTEIKIS